MADSEALHALKSTEPPQWLTPSPQLSQTARTASQHLFASILPFCPKSHLNALLVEGFDAEQIWQQIDLQTEALVANLKRDVKRFEKNPDVISKSFGGDVRKKKEVRENKESKEVDEEVEEEVDEEEEESEGFDDMEEDEGEDEDDEEERSDGEFEDKFLKMRDLEEYMKKDEEREYGGLDNDGKGDEDEDEDEDEDDDEIGEDSDEEDDKLGQAKYEDFFGGNKIKNTKRVSKPRDELEDDESEDNEQEDGEQEDGEQEDDEQEDDEQEEDEGLHNQTSESLSTHEKQQEKRRSKIEQLEKANLEPKSWIMQGEVTASRRPKNSALEVDLDFEHNVRPMPVITEEVTASLEDLIKKRILEEQFDDVQNISLPSKAPKEIKELDENKSKKGLGDIYEEEYAQQTGLGPSPVSSSDELKKESTQLFEKLCLKLDALSHFHFKPKPVIEDMSIQTNVPALAMEEIAPVAVSDAAMLAPEEVFAGKGDIKEDAELTQEERKRRRANKKRKHKVEESRRGKKKVQDNTSSVEASTRVQKKLPDSTTPNKWTGKAKT